MAQGDVTRAIYKRYPNTTTLVGLAFLGFIGVALWSECFTMFIDGTLSPTSKGLASLIAVAFLIPLLLVMTSFVLKKEKSSRDRLRLAIVLVANGAAGWIALPLRHTHQYLFQPNIRILLLPVITESTTLAAFGIIWALVRQLMHGGKL
jgi:hypothetical protein